jgi:hypothetical protein
VTEVVFGQLDASNGKMLESIDQLLANILIPLLQQYEVCFEIEEEIFFNLLNFAGLGSIEKS